jgi:hypothetical protein
MRRRYGIQTSLSARERRISGRFGSFGGSFGRWS